MTIADNTTAWLKTTAHPSFLTLTLRHSGARLRSQVKAIVKFFKIFRQLPVLKRRIRGGLWFLQITYNATTDQWHPHLHVLADMDYTPQKLLSKLWHTVTRSSMIVDIRRVKNVQKAADYVARYSARPCNLRDLPNLVRVELIEQLHGQRMVNAFGTAHNAGILNKPKYAAQTWIFLAPFYAVQFGITCGVDTDAVWEAWQTRTPLPIQDKPPPEPKTKTKQETLWDDVDAIQHWRT